jgi:hypothetical protein
VSRCSPLSLERPETFSREVAFIRGWRRQRLLPNFRRTNSRVRSRLVATVRTSFMYAMWRSTEYGATGLGFNFVTIDLGQSTIFLDGTNCSRVSGVGVSHQKLAAIGMVGR